MDKHPISDLMETTMQKIREMVDVNTIVGDPISTPEGITIIPVSKVSFGFASGGSDFSSKSAKAEQPPVMFGGGSGAGVHIVPIAFLVINDTDVKLLPVTPPAGNTVDRVVELIPGLIDKIKRMFHKKEAEKRRPIVFCGQAQTEISAVYDRQSCPAVTPNKYR
jgi:sporulation protein YtfJ